MIPDNSGYHPDLFEADEPLLLGLSEEIRLTFLNSLAPTSARAVAEMEMREPWPIDNRPAVIRAYETLTHLLEPDQVVELALNPTPDLLKVLGLCNVSRALAMIRQMAGIAQMHSDAQDPLLSLKKLAREDSVSRMSFRILSARILHLERVGCLSRIYDPRRSRVIAQAFSEI